MEFSSRAATYVSRTYMKEKKSIQIEYRIKKAIERRVTYIPTH
jgi:hypothetical protein